MPAAVAGDAHDEALAFAPVPGRRGCGAGIVAGTSRGSGVTDLRQRICQEVPFGQVQCARGDPQNASRICRLRRNAQRKRIFAFLRLHKSSPEGRDHRWKSRREKGNGQRGGREKALPLMRMTNVSPARPYRK